MKVVPMKTKPLGMSMWHQGAFGNKLRTWNTFESWTENEYWGPTGLRYSDPRGGGNVFQAHVHPARVRNQLDQWKRQGKDVSRVTFCEEAPDHELIVNGELADDWTFYHSHIRKPMRQALKEGGHYCHGIATRVLLKTVMTPSAWEDLLAIMDLYPDHIIELSVYTCHLGILKGRNTIIWEVRQY